MGKLPGYIAAKYNNSFREKSEFQFYLSYSFFFALSVRNVWIAGLALHWTTYLSAYITLRDNVNRRGALNLRNCCHFSLCSFSRCNFSNSHFLSLSCYSSTPKPADLLFLLLSSFRGTFSYDFRSYFHVGSSLALLDDVAVHFRHVLASCT